MPIYTSSVISSLQSLDWRGFLARPALPSLPPEAVDALISQPILITGAGGSIGSALTLRLARRAPPKLVLLEASESNLYSLERDWAACGAPTVVTTILGSVADRPLLEEVFAAHGPRIVFHAAAFKQVPLMEEQPLAAIANNIFATETLVRVATAHGQRVILLSTDKAVQPASVMGATKRVAEQIILSSGGTVLRLGNVLASRDSVTEVFARQIAEGGPLTVTSPSARRYFLTLDEAVSLLLMAATYPGPAALLAPVLPATHLVADLARFMARALAPDRAIALAFTGPRPGDKEFEILWKAGDLTCPVGLQGMVSVETAAPAEAQLAGRLPSLRMALDARDLGAALVHLESLVPDYTPSQAVLALSRRLGPQVYS
jgi:FlaA1/EpsC-like NDP-sugar epimerase